MSLDFRAESLYSTAAEAARFAKKTIKPFHRIRYLLDLSHRRKVERVLPLWAPGSFSQRTLINRQPGFGHSNRHDANGRRINFEEVESRANLRRSKIERLVFGVAMNE